MADPASVVVIGAGPAGWAIASALHARGVPVTVVAPAPDLAWPQTFGVWTDELEAVGLAHVAAHTWSDAWVHAEERLFLSRRYTRIDNAALRARFASPAIARVSASVSGTVCATNHVRVETTAGPLYASVVVDARGASGGIADAWQSAYGVELDWPEHPFPRHAVGLMDLRDAPDTHPVDLPPSFLYVMPLSNDRVFLEETALATRDPVPFTLLEARLKARLVALGGPGADGGPVERCRVPLRLSLPPLPDGVVAFGSAAGMIHPATGYQLGHALRAAPELAEALSSALSAGPRAAARAGRALMQSRSRRIVAGLHDLGLSTLLRLDSAEIRDFFGSFFSLPPESWQAWLDSRASPVDVARAMWRFFSGSPPQVRRLVGRGLIPSALYVGGAS